MKKQWPAWIVLGLIALVAGGALGFTNELTAPVIADQAAAAAVAARQEVLPAATAFEEVDLSAAVPSNQVGTIDNCFTATANGQPVGHTVQVTVTGYGGPIEVVVGIDTSGTVTGVNIGGSSFSETPGLGAKVQEPAFYEQFAGLTPPAVLKGNIDSVSGASISSGAVVDAVNTAVECVANLG